MKRLILRLLFTREQLRDLTILLNLELCRTPDKRLWGRLNGIFRAVVGRDHAEHPRYDD